MGNNLSQASQLGTAQLGSAGVGMRVQAGWSQSQLPISRAGRQPPYLPEQPWGITAASSRPFLQVFQL